MKSLVVGLEVSSGVSMTALNFFIFISFMLRRRTLSSSALFWNKSAIDLRALRDSRLTSGDEFALKATRVDKKVPRSFNLRIAFPSFSMITLNARAILAFD